MMLVLLLLTLIPLMGACPSFCTCNNITNNGYSIKGLDVICFAIDITSEQLEKTEFPIETKIIYLYIRKLPYIPENTFAYIEGLEQLTLDSNNLNTIHENTFAHNTNLKELYLQDNNLTTLHENTFANNNNLEILRLSNNNLNTIHENTFANNNNLKKLRLDKNNLNTIHENTFANNNDLYELSLSNNNLTTIHENTFANNNHLKVLNLSNNPLHCDCRMQNTFSISMTFLWGTCQSPEIMKGRLLRIFARELICTSCATLDPCKNDAECFSLDEVHYECSCKPGYHGNHCEQALTVSRASISLNEVEDRVMLSCVIKASWPPNKVYWVHNGVKSMAQLSDGDGSGEEPTGGLKPGFVAGKNLEGSQECILKDFVFDLEITGYIQLGRYSCGVFDEDFMAEKVESNQLEVYYPGPTFTSSPSLLEKGYEGRFSSNSDIKGCQFSSKFPLVPRENVYWLKDGYKNMSVYAIQNGKMSNLFIGVPSLSKMGYYQCAIFIPGYTKQPILSQAASVQLADSTSAKLSIRLAWDWKEQYLNRTSKEFKSLENALGNELSRTFRYPSIVVLNVRKGSVIVDVRVSTPVEEDRLKACDLRMEATPFVEITALSVDIQSLDCCPSVAFGESGYKGEYSFPKTLTGRSVSQICKYNDVNETVRTVSRKCMSDLQIGPRWGDADFSRCNAKLKTTQDLISLSNTPICTTDSEGCSPVVDVAENLTQTVTNGTQLKIYQDVELTATTIANVVNALNYTNQTEQVVDDVLQTVNSVLEAEVQIVADAQIKEMSSTKILQSLDKLANEVRKVLSNETTFTVNKPNIALRLQQVDRSDVTLLASPTVNDTVEISFTNTSVFKAKPMDLVLIQIPSEAFNSSSDIVHSYFFKQDSLFLTERQLLKRSGRQADGGLVVQSNVLSATVGDGKVENLSTPIILTFKKTKVLDSPGNDNCQFWNPNIETIVKGVFGKWLDDGCRLYAEGLNNDEFTSCQCDHLTNFALLLDMNQNAENPLQLQIVTWIGCGISLAGLFLTVLTYSVFPNIRKKLAPKILICLCVSLIGLLVSFLAGADQTKPRVGCQIVAGVIHFFMLSTFCWMLVEAAGVYKSFVIISLLKKEASSDKNFFTKAILFGWGVPAIIVIVTGAVRPEELGNDKICVIRGHPFYFAVVLPVCLILLVNFIVLGVTMYSLSHRGHQLEKKYRNYYKYHARIAFTLASLLGLSWLFGLLAVWNMTMVFQWIFCITTSLQGLFIFIFYTIRNKDVQKEWIRRIRPNDNNNTLSNSSAQPTSNNRTHQTQLNMNSLSRSTPSV